MSEILLQFKALDPCLCSKDIFIPVRQSVRDPFKHYLLINPNPEIRRFNNAGEKFQAALTKTSQINAYWL